MTKTYLCPGCQKLQSHLSTTSGYFRSLPDCAWIEYNCPDCRHEIPRTQLEELLEDSRCFERWRLFRVDDGELFTSPTPINCYVCPHCSEPQSDAVITIDGSYLDRDNRATDYSCPNCHGTLNGDHLAQLDGEA